ncbi:hypothetical protein H4R33_004555, partial [Dimargaris cristalligena]
MLLYVLTPTPTFRSLFLTALSQKTAVITGGSRGIGLAIAQLFASQGARCTIVGRNQSHLDRALTLLAPLPLASIENSGSPSSTVGHSAVRCDIAHSDQVVDACR